MCPADYVVDAVSLAADAMPPDKTLGPSIDTDLCMHTGAKRVHA